MHDRAICNRNHELFRSNARRLFREELEPNIDNTRFKLAEMKTSLAVGWAWLDQCLERINAGALSNEEGAMAKLWTTGTGNRIVDDCVQWFGGCGYMGEYPISRLFVDSRVRRIYGGWSEIMKLVIGRSI